MARENIDERRRMLDKDDKKTTLEEAKYCPVCGKGLNPFSPGNITMKTCPDMHGIMKVSSQRDGGQFVLHFKKFQA